MYRMLILVYVLGICSYLTACGSDGPDLKGFVTFTEDTDGSDPSCGKIDPTKDLLAACDAYGGSQSGATLLENGAWEFSCADALNSDLYFDTKAGTGTFTIVTGECRSTYTLELVK